MIPHHEIYITFARSSGPGGQNVNKVASKVQLSWHIGRSSAVNEDQKHLIRTALRRYINTHDEIMLSSDASRSQLMNKTQVIARLQLLVRQALVPKKKRKATKPTRSSREKRLREKSHVAKIKKGRKMQGE